MTSPNPTKIMFFFFLFPLLFKNDDAFSFLCSLFFSHKALFFMTESDRFRTQEKRARCVEECHVIVLLLVRGGGGGGDWRGQGQLGFQRDL